MARNNCPEMLKKAVREYYEWQGDKRSFAIQILKNRSNDRMVLARFVDGSTGEKTSSLMYFSTWADGHYDVTEYDTIPRDFEDVLVEEFKDSYWGPMFMTDDDDDEDEGDLSGTPADEYEHEEEIRLRKMTFDGGCEDEEEVTIL